jgi:protein-S-isoprenylcysteine O-methyltransferase Ste14
MPLASEILLVCWAVFWLYWVASAFGSKKNTRSNLGRFAAVRLVFFVVAIVVVRLADWQSYSFENHLVAHNLPLQLVGLALFFLGLLLALWARRYLGRNWGMPMTQKQNPELVTSGPYHYIRHPIYTGILVAVIGSCLASSLYWLVVLIIMGSYFIYSAVVEERLMTKQFPDTYPAYKRRSKMLIPFVF